MNLNNIQRPKGLFQTLFFLGMAWLILRFLNVPKEDGREEASMPNEAT